MGQVNRMKQWGAMKRLAVVVEISAALMMVMSISACGVNSGCTNTCIDFKEKILAKYHPEIEVDELLCHEPPLSEAETCFECTELLYYVFKIPLSDEICEGHFDQEHPKDFPIWIHFADFR